MAEMFPAVSALASIATTGDPVSDGAGVGVTLTERPVFRALHLAGPRDREAAARAVGISRLPAPNRSAGDGAVRLHWIAPGAWLAVAYGASGSPNDTLRSFFEIAADIGGGWTVIRTEGSSVRQVLAAHCALDLHPSVFRIGHCAQTRMAQVNVMIDRPQGENVFDLIVARSYAVALLESLAEGAAYRGCVIRPS